MALLQYFSFLLFIENDLQKKAKQPTLSLRSPGGRLLIQAKDF